MSVLRLISFLRENTYYLLSNLTDRLFKFLQVQFESITENTRTQVRHVPKNMRMQFGCRPTSLFFCHAIRMQPYSTYKLYKYVDYIL